LKRNEEKHENGEKWEKGAHKAISQGNGDCVNISNLIHTD